MKGGATKSVWRKVRRSDGRTIFRYRSAVLGDTEGDTFILPVDQVG